MLLDIGTKARLNSIYQVRSAISGAAKDRAEDRCIKRMISRAFGLKLDPDEIGSSLFTEVKRNDLDKNVILKALQPLTANSFVDNPISSDYRNNSVHLFPTRTRKFLTYKKFEKNGLKTKLLQLYAKSPADELWQNKMQGAIAEQFRRNVWLNRLSIVTNSPFRISLHDQSGETIVTPEVFSSGCKALLTKKNNSDTEFLRDIWYYSSKKPIILYVTPEKKSYSADFDFSSIVRLLVSAQVVYILKRSYKVQSLAYCTIKREYFERIASRYKVADDGSSLTNQQKKVISQLAFFRCNEVMLNDQIRSDSVIMKLIRSIKKPNGSIQGTSLIKRLIDKLYTLTELINGLSFLKEKNSIHLQRANRLLGINDGSVNVKEIRMIKSDLRTQHNMAVKKKTVSIKKNSEELAGILKEISEYEPDEPLLRLELTNA